MSIASHAQTNFKAKFRKADPLKADSKLTIIEKIVFYNDYLKKAKKNKNTEQEFYGHLYLFLNHYKVRQYL